MHNDHLELTLFDKLRLANCAAERARLYVADGDRFAGEHNTVRTWMRHNVVQYRTMDGQLVTYTH